VDDCSQVPDEWGQAFPLSTGSLLDNLARRLWQFWFRRRRIFWSCLLL